MAQREEWNDAADPLCATVTGLHLDGCLSGSLIDHWAAMAGVQPDLLASMGLHPGAPVSHYHHHMDARSASTSRRLGLCTYTRSFDMVQCCRTMRGMSVLRTRPCAKSCQPILDNGLGWLTRCVQNEWTPSYHAHEVARHSDAGMVPPWHCRSTAFRLP